MANPHDQLVELRTEGQRGGFHEEVYEFLVTLHPTNFYVVDAFGVVENAADVDTKRTIAAPDDATAGTLRLLAPAHLLEFDEREDLLQRPLHRILAFQVLYLVQEQPTFDLAVLV